MGSTLCNGLTTEAYNTNTVAGSDNYGSAINMKIEGNLRLPQHKDHIATQAISGLESTTGCGGMCYCVTYAHPH